MLVIFNSDVSPQGPEIQTLLAHVAQYHADFEGIAPSYRAE